MARARTSNATIERFVAPARRMPETKGNAPKRPGRDVSEINFRKAAKDRTGAGPGTPNTGADTGLRRLRRRSA